MFLTIYSTIKQYRPMKNPKVKFQENCEEYYSPIQIVNFSKKKDMNPLNNTNGYLYEIEIILLLTEGVFHVATVQEAENNAYRTQILIDFRHAPVMKSKSHQMKLSLLVQRSNLPGEHLEGDVHQLVCTSLDS